MNPMRGRTHAARWTLAGAVILTGLGMVGSAAAQTAPADGDAKPATPAAPPPPEKSPNEKEAEQRFGRARQLYEEGDYTLALVEFQRAYELAPNYRVLYNIAQVQIQLQNYAAARGTLEKYLKEGGTEITGQRRQQAESDLQMLKTRTAYLRIVTTPPAEVAIDDKPAGTTPMSAPVLVNGGSHKITVSKRGFSSATKFVTLAGGDNRDETFTLQAEPAGDQGPKLTTVTRKNYTPAVVAWAATGTLIVGAAIFGGLYLNKQSEIDDYNENKKAISREDADNLSAAGTRLAITADVLGLLAIGGAAIATYFTVKPPSRAEITAAKIRLEPRANGFAASF